MIGERIAEGPRLDYKRELHLRTKGERLEAAKDASGLANADGGLLIYGVQEEELSDGQRVPVGATPLADAGLQAQLEDVLFSSVAPRLNVATHLLEAPEGGFFLLVRLQSHMGIPHMVDAYDQNRYFIRAGLATRRMEAHEVERAFRDANRGLAEVDVLVSDLPLVPRIGRSRTRELDSAIGGEPAGIPWTSVVVAAVDAPRPLLPMRNPSQLDFPINPVDGLLGDPHYVRGPLFAIDSLGYLDEQTHRATDLLHRRTRLYRDGVFEWGFRYFSRGGGARLFSRSVINNVHDALRYFARVFTEAPYFGRLRVWIRLDNADAAEFAVEDELVFAVALDAPRTPSIEDVEYVEDTNVEQLLNDPMTTVHAAMDLLWQAFGFNRCLLFTDEGRFLSAQEVATLRRV